MKRNGTIISDARNVYSEEWVKQKHKHTPDIRHVYAYAQRLLDEYSGIWHETASINKTNAHCQIKRIYEGT